MSSRLEKKGDLDLVYREMVLRFQKLLIYSDFSHKMISGLQKLDRLFQDDSKTTVA